MAALTVLRVGKPCSTIVWSIVEDNWHIDGGQCVADCNTRGISHPGAHCLALGRVHSVPLLRRLHIDHVVFVYVDGGGLDVNHRAGRPPNVSPSAALPRVTPAAAPASVKRKHLSVVQCHPHVDGEASVRPRGGGSLHLRRPTVAARASLCDEPLGFRGFGVSGYGFRGYGFRVGVTGNGVRVWGLRFGV